MAASQPIYGARGEQDLMLELWDPRLSDNPHEFVRFVYPWGKAGTPLEHLTGPRNWQDAQLKDIAAYIRSARTHQQIHKAVGEMYREAIASGRGIGKSALFAMVAHWLMSTRIGASVWVTANGEPQLKTKTFPEIAKWITLAINSHWFDVSATKIEPAGWIKEAVQRDLKIDPKYWYIAAQLWSEENPDAFAGAHNVYGEMYLFDEASGIPSPIWTVAQGVFTEQIVDRYWLAFSNPRRNSGAFFECFHKDRTQWRTRQIDARQVEGLAQDAYDAIVAKHGADSDEAKIEVYGQFPSSGHNQFIPKDQVMSAQEREPIPDPGAPLLLGVDVARFGKDSTVLAFRKGRDATSIPWQVYRGLDTVQIATRVAEALTKYKVDAVFVDGNGVGGGVVDNLKAWGHRVIEVQAGATPNDPDKYLNKRVEMWALTKEWLTIGSIPKLADLLPDLIGPEYSYHPVTSKLCLETKEKMMDRGLASPNLADALAMTFAQTVARNDARTSRSHSRTRQATGLDYDVLGAGR
jgi:hypothetical protein